jgi:hypothetical protein
MTDARTQKNLEDEQQAAAQAEFQRYCQEHPGSPSAVRRPRLLRRGQSWIALLGYTPDEGIAGIGPSVPAALGEFDAEYLNSLRPPRG